MAEVIKAVISEKPKKIIISGAGQKKSFSEEVSKKKESVPKISGEEGQLDPHPK